MQTPIDAELHTFRDWVFRFRPAKGQASRLLVMLHGLTGNENAMWVFARHLPAQVAVLAPRGSFPAPEGGYTWRVIPEGRLKLPDMDELRPSAEALIGFIDEWSVAQGVKADQFDVIGFSQGAALTYTMAILHPERIRALAALSGFIPAGAEALIAKCPLEGKPVFIAHGKQDHTVPVSLARRSVALLRGSGAQVTYCESDGGHKVSAECFPGIERIFR